MVEVTFLNCLTNIQFYRVLSMAYVIKPAWKRGPKIKVAVTVNYLNEIAPMLMRLCSSITLMIFSSFFLNEHVTKLT